MTYAEGAEARRRLLRTQKELAHREAFLARGFKGLVNPVRGACAVCTLLLRDPVSLARAIGPDCWDNFYRELPDYLATMRRGDADALFWLGAIELDAFQAHVRRAASAAR